VSAPGWYPDPGGQAGTYRFWTGSEWTPAVTTNPAATPPPTAPLGSQRPVEAPPRRRTSPGLWIAGVVGVLVLGLVVWLVTQGIGRLAAGEAPFPVPSGTASQNVCPKSSTSTSLEPESTPGRVSGGRLSFPRLGSPWSEPQLDNRVPYGSLAAEQIVEVEPDFDGEGSSWVASDLFVGDGFASVQVGAETVLKCVLGTYYSNAEVQRQDISSTSHPVDGHPGWLLQTQLSFDIPNLQTKGERVMLVVVQVDLDQYGLFYASIPDTVAELQPDAQTALDGLRVDA
jgi:hypothetical protein